MGNNLVAKANTNCTVPRTIPIETVLMSVGKISPTNVRMTPKMRGWHNVMIMKPKSGTQPIFNNHFGVGESTSKI